MENLKNNHNPSIKGIYTEYICKKLFHSGGLILSISLSIVCFIFLFFFSTVDDYVLLSKIIEINISIFPALLGFCVGGYALIIGFGHKEMLQKMSEPNEEKSNMSLFQIMSSIFAASIIVQIITFLLSFIISYLLNFDLNSSNETLCGIVNITAISIICFLSIYSIILIYYMVINIFIFGQMMHFCIRNELLNKKSDEDTLNIEVTINKLEIKDTDKKNKNKKKKNI
jgi:hypothetical protein